MEKSYATSKIHSLSLHERIEQNHSIVPTWQTAEFNASVLSLLCINHSVEQFHNIIESVHAKDNFPHANKLLHASGIFMKSKVAQFSQH